MNITIPIRIVLLNLGVISLLVSLPFLQSCKDAPESYTYKICGNIYVQDSCGPPIRLSRDTLDAEVKITYHLRHPDSTRLSGTAVVHLDSFGKASYCVEVNSGKKLKSIASWGVPKVQINCPKTRCTPIRPDSDCRAISNTTLHPIPMDRDSIHKDLSYTCRCTE